MNKIVTMIALAVALCGLHFGALGQPYPSRPVRMIMPFPPGGSTDVLGRIVAEQLTSAFGQPVLVDNRAGASAQIGTEVVKVDGVVADCLGCINVNEDTLRLASGHHLSHGLPGAYFVVSPLDMHDGGVGANRLEHFVGINAPVVIGAHQRHAAVGLRPESYRGVLHGRQYLVRTPLGRPPAGRRDCLGCPTGEHHRTRAGAEEVGHLFSGGFYRHPGFESLGIDASGVTSLAQPLSHQGERLGAQGRGRRVVQVVPRHESLS